MEWIDRKNGYPKLKTEILGNYEMMSISLEISEVRSFGFRARTGKDMNMSDAIGYILNNFNTLDDKLKDELKECKNKLND